jgi:L,D-transpeptidase ErfK/SrfK
MEISGSKMRRLSILIPILALAAAASCAPVLPRAASVTGRNSARSLVVGERFEYSVQSGDTLLGIGARFAVSPRSLAARNRITPSARLAPGQVLRVDNRHIVPGVLENGILINVPQRLLFLFEDGRLAAWYPVATGRPGWQTPTGSYEILAKEENPTWEVPVSIQREMRSKGEKVRKRVPPGPDNPLGRYWLGLSLTCCGIYGTNAPQSVYQLQTHGCIRLAPEDVADLFTRVSVGLPVRIIYEPILFARDRKGALFMEVHPDAYRRTKGLREKAMEVAASRGAHGAWESPLWDDVLRGQEGIAVSLHGTDLARAGE